MQALRFLACLALAGLSLAQSQDSDENSVTGGGQATPKRYILEFNDAADYAEAVKQISSRKGTKIVKQFNSTDVFSGLSIESTLDDADSLSTIGSVARAWPAARVELQPILNATFNGALGAAYYSIHNMTGVDKLHEAGIYGKGAVVAVIDTGIDYLHPDLGGGFGSGFKVAGGYDFVGDGYWPYEGDKEPDADPIDYYGHGTHVAGIIAGKNDWFTGVAPEATLLAFKVFTTAGVTDEDTLIESFLHAYDAGADVITASIGGPSGWGDNAWAIVADRLVSAGVVVTIAAGNNGQLGPFLASSGSSGKNVLAVASIEATQTPSLSFSASFEQDGQSEVLRIAYSSGYDFPPAIKDYPVLPLDPCSPLPADTPDLETVIPLIKIGFCPPGTKEKNLAPFNPRYIFLYVPNVPDNDGVYIGDYTSMWARLQTQPAEAMVATVNNGGHVTASIPDIAEFVGVFNEIAYTPSYFTSFGGTYDLDLKPDIAAPGSNILSMYLNGGYASMSGTSMACPYIAGVAALYIGKFGGRATNGPSIASKIHARILSSGEPLIWGTALGLTDKRASATQIGNGLVNATKVLGFDTQLSYSKFVLNDTHHYSRYQSVDITNNAKTEVTYTFEVLPDGSYNSFTAPDSSGFQAIGLLFDVMLNPIEIAPQVKLPSGTYKLQPGQTKKAEFVFDIPSGLEESRLPVFSGKVLIKGSNGEQLSVPYFGVGGNVKSEMRAKGLFHEKLKYPRMSSTTQSVSLANKPWFSFNTSLDEQDFPRLTALLTYGSQELRWDIFEETWKERDWKFPPVIGENGFVGSATSFANAGGQDWFDPAIDDENNLVTFPQLDLFRQGVYSFWWLGRFSNGSHIAPGRYKMRVATLLPFGNREASDNWDVWTTPTFEVVA